MVFIFFKQKTAYEMRISDWSSDVCSSDLPKMLSDAIGSPGPWSSAERRLAPIVALVVCAWITAPLLGGALPPGLADDGVIAILGALLLFVVPAGDGRPILVWRSEGDTSARQSLMRI